MDAFRRKAHTIARLVHPHIVRVFDFGIEGETPFLVMDYAPNDTVRKRHPKGVALPLPTILGYVKQVADALQYAHDEHFIHRDVKPENLLVGRRQEVLLSDFGIALIAQTSRSQSMQDVAGTASYMAPEQFQGKPRPASDQYALAVMAYEWLTGACPFRGSFTEIASQHLFVPPPPLQGRIPAISPVVEQVVMTALAKDPRQRFGSVQAFATAFEQASQVDASQTLPASRSLPPTDAMSQFRPVQPPPELATAPSESVIPTELVTPPGQSSVPTEQSAPSSQTAIPTEVVTPPRRVVSLPPVELAAPASQAAALPTEVALPSRPSGGQSWSRQMDQRERFTQPPQPKKSPPFAVIIGLLTFALVVVLLFSVAVIQRSLAPSTTPSSGSPGVQTPGSSSPAAASPTPTPKTIPENRSIPCGQSSCTVMIVLDRVVIDTSKRNMLWTFTLSSGPGCSDGELDLYLEDPSGIQYKAGGQVGPGAPTWTIAPGQSADVVALFALLPTPGVAYQLYVGISGFCHAAYQTESFTF